MLLFLKKLNKVRDRSRCARKNARHKAKNRRRHLRLKKWRAE